MTAARAVFVMVPCASGCGAQLRRSEKQAARYDAWCPACRTYAVQEALKRHRQLHPAAPRQRDNRRPSVTADAKERRCLMCATAFLSSGIGERVCTACKATEVWRTADSRQCVARVSR